jgi:hypothetical protein
MYKTACAFASRTKGRDFLFRGLLRKRGLKLLRFVVHPAAAFACVANSEPRYSRCSTRPRFGLSWAPPPCAPAAAPPRTPARRPAPHAGQVGKERAAPAPVHAPGGVYLSLLDWSLIPVANLSSQKGDVSQTVLLTRSPYHSAAGPGHRAERSAFTFNPPIPIPILYSPFKPPPRAHPVSSRQNCAGPAAPADGSADAADNAFPDRRTGRLPRSTRQPPRPQRPGRSPSIQLPPHLASPGDVHPACALRAETPPEIVVSSHHGKPHALAAGSGMDPAWDAAQWQVDRFAITAKPTPAPSIAARLMGFFGGQDGKTQNTCQVRDRRDRRTVPPASAGLVVCARLVLSGAECGALLAAGHHMAPPSPARPAWPPRRRRADPRPPPLARRLTTAPPTWPA